MSSRSNWRLILSVSVVAALLIGGVAGYLIGGVQTGAGSGVTVTRTITREVAGPGVTATITREVTVTNLVTVTKQPEMPVVRIGRLTSGTAGVITQVMEDLKLLDKYGLTNYQFLTFSAEEDGPAFFFGKIDIFFSSAEEVAEFTSKGVPTTIFAPGAVAHAAVVVRADSPYQTWKDLVGKKIGNPGFTTTTYKFFKTLSKMKYGLDAEKDFTNVIGGMPALIGYLERGEVEAILTWEAFVSRLLASGKYRVLEKNFNGIWIDLTGQPLVFSAPAARTEWLNRYPEAARAIALATFEAIEWIISHPQETIQKYGEKFFGVSTDAEKKLAAESITKAPWYTRDWELKLFNAQMMFVQKMVELGILTEMPKGQLYADVRR